MDDQFWHEKYGSATPKAKKGLSGLTNSKLKLYPTPLPNIITSF